ncbi:MAG: hypothetical protein ABIZ81_09005 [Opitutaceae bacterium]
MKLRAFRHRFIVFSAVALLAVRLVAAVEGDVKKNPVAPATKAAADEAAKKKAEEPMGKVEGIEVKYGSGYFGIELLAGNFKLTFYDAKRKVIPAPMPRAALRWPVNYRPADERTVLNLSEDGKALTSAKVVKPPYLFKLFITFLAEGADEAGGGGESFTVDFRS